MKTIKIGKYEWYLIKELADKTLLFAVNNIIDGYFDDNSNDYLKSKVNSFLTSVFFKNLKTVDFNPEKIVNGIWLLTSIQYENYIKPLNIPVTAPFLLRTAGASEDMIKCVNSSGDVIDVGIKERVGVRPGFMLDTAYVNELMQKQEALTASIEQPANKLPNQNTNDVVNTSVTQEKVNIPENQNENISDKKESDSMQSVSTVKQDLENRLKPPIFNTSKNNEKNITPNNITKETVNNESGKKQFDEQATNNVAPKNNQNNISQNNASQKNNQNNKKSKNKKKKAKNKKIETVKPVINVQDTNSIYEINDDELSLLEAVELSEKNAVDSVVEVKNTYSETPQANIIETAKNENKKEEKNQDNNFDLNKNEQEKQMDDKEPVISNDNIPLINNADSSKVSDTQISDEIEDLEIVQIETLPEIIPVQHSTKPIVASEPVKSVTQSPFIKNTNRHKESSFKKINKNNNETFASTTQQNAKKGQNAIMSKLGAITPPVENEMSTAIAAYTSDNAKTVMNKQTPPSSYSQNMSEINQFTIEQLRDILIKRNKQIAKLKLSIIEITAEHEAMLENISKTKTEIENYKTEVESLTNEVEQLKKSANKNEISATEEREELIVQHKKNVDKLTSQLKDSENNLKEAKDSLSSMIETGKKHETKIEELSIALSNKEQELQKCKELLSEQSNALNNSQQTEVLNKQIEELTQENKNIQCEKEDLLNQITALNSIIEAQKNEIKSKEELKDSSVSDSKEYQDLTNEITSMKAEMIKTLRAAKKLKEDLDEKSEQITAQKATIKELTEKLNEIHSENSGLKGDIENLKASIEDSHKKASSTEEKLKEAHQKNEELQSVIGNNTLTMHDMAAEISNLRKQNRILNEDAEKSHTLTKALIESDKEKETKIKELENKINAYEEKIKEHNKKNDEMTKYKESVDELTEVIKQKDAIIKEKDATIKNLSDNINSSYDDLSEFKNLILEE